MDHEQTINNGKTFGVEFLHRKRIQITHYVNIERVPIMIMIIEYDLLR